MAINKIEYTIKFLTDSENTTEVVRDLDDYIRKYISDKYVMGGVESIVGCGPASIYDLKLTSRSFYALARSDIWTIEQVCECTERDILKLEGIGEKSLKDIKKSLNAIGRTLKEEK